MRGCSKERIQVLTAGLAMLVVLGCAGSEQSSGPKTADVSGTVYLDGKPLAGADVHFVSPDGKFVGYGQTDSQGKYTLVQGAVPGKNKVFISKLEMGESELNPEEGIDPGQMEAAAAALGTGEAGAEEGGPKQLIPEAYSDPEKTKLTFDVPEGGTSEAEFRLTSQ
ncbi:MAG TPA: carboxypeptidase regulatory-like domain-containing protein [Planctomycetaceae bacterium]|nr:carboxypeptidase regulatory-like domain-containing protein [Planctomycetaceae bacterium]